MDSPPPPTHSSNQALYLHPPSARQCPLDTMAGCTPADEVVLGLPALQLEPRTEKEWWSAVPPAGRNMQQSPCELNSSKFSEANPPEMLMRISGPMLGEGVSRVAIPWYLLKMDGFGSDVSLQPQLAHL